VEQTCFVPRHIALWSKRHRIFYRSEKLALVATYTENFRSKIVSRSRSNLFSKFKHFHFATVIPLWIRQFCKDLTAVVITEFDRQCRH
jgi:hypothetical protein